MSHEPETLWGSAAKLFEERPRDNRFDPRELRPKGRSYVIREQGGERAWDRDEMGRTGRKGALADDQCAKPEPAGMAQARGET